MLINRFRKVGEVLAFVYILMPVTTFAGDLSFSHNNKTFVLDTTNSFCDFSAEQQATFESSQKTLEASGMARSLIGQSACKTVSQFPNSNINLRWQGKVAPNLNILAIKKSIEDNFLKHTKFSTKVQDLAKNFGSDVQTTTVLETANDQAMLYTLFDQKLPNSKKTVKLESYISYIYIPVTGDIFILALTNTKSKTTKELRLLVKLSSSISNSLKLGG